MWRLVFFLLIIIDYSFADLFIVIPIFNRAGYVCLVLQNLGRSYCPNCKLYLLESFDSTIGKDQLLLWSANMKNVEYGRQVLPTHVSSNEKANAMAQNAHRLFEKSNFSHLLVLDSDMLPCRDWYRRMTTGLRDLIGKSGVLTLYRSGAPWHKPLACGIMTCSMPSIGNGGTIWTRAMSKHVMNMRIGFFGWDSSWTDQLRLNGYTQLALKESALLHIGMHGGSKGESLQEKAVDFPYHLLRVLDYVRVKGYLRGDDSSKCNFEY